MSRRERSTIVGDILAAVAAHSSESHEGARITSITTAANLPHDRLVVYLRELEARGLIADPGRPRLTEEGRDLLREYRSWIGALMRFGLGDDLPVELSLFVEGPRAGPQRPESLIPPF